MSQRRQKSLRAAAAALGLLLIFGAAYLIFGWGLGKSDTEASYGLIAYLTEANGQSFEEPFAIAVDARNGNVVVTDIEEEVIRVRVLPDGRMDRENAAKYLGKAPKTLAMWTMNGKGPPTHRLGGRCYYYKQQLDAFIRGDAGPTASA